MTPRDRARAMRKALTPPEARLWVALRRLRAEGWLFRRQAPVFGSFLDFVCFERRLVVENDGAHHQFPDQLRHDQRRDAVLAAAEFLTLRYPNASIRDNLAGVMDGIRDALSRRPVCGFLRKGPTRPLRGHPPLEGEGK
ncbi:MAG: endonuclease domain-containing protein [Brevundimonas sp.]|uniref:endonuclease domain-containing protein n=1 Tax=Brevundimonas sp. TaxID=1871086 RepID=UPI0022C69E75|nr:endonuclease domain-containing protein [Brevundimonas sp.]MCZ8194046.1 endonuclease domain-containing protein [Brevundimonas sp.]